MRGGPSTTWGTGIPFLVIPNSDFFFSWFWEVVKKGRTFDVGRRTSSTDGLSALSTGLENAFAIPDFSVVLVVIVDVGQECVEFLFVESV